MGLWKTISNIGIRGDEDLDHVRRIHMINRSCFLGFVTTVFFTGELLAIGAIYYFWVMAVTSFLTFIPLVLSKYGKPFHGNLLALFVLLVNITYCSLELKGTGVEFFLVPLGMIPFTIFRNKRFCNIFVILTLLAFFISAWLKTDYVPHDLIKKEYITLTFYMITASLFFLCYMIVFQFRLLSDGYEKVIEQQIQEAEQKNKEITDSIRYAKRIQQSILPTARFISRTIKRLKKED
jgi:hypothetical protein